MEDRRRLPIKVVIPQEADLQPVPAGGAGRKIFGKPGRKVRDTLLSQVAVVRCRFEHILAQTGGPPAVARVVLKKKALAKSHRPAELFSKNTCPIIGGESFGSLLVSVSANGLNRLQQKIDRDKRTSIRADISTVDRIEPFTADDAAGPGGVEGLSRAVAEQKIRMVKLRLFRHKESRVDSVLRKKFFEFAKSLKLPEPEPLQYVSDLRVYRMNGITPDTVAQLAGFVGTQSLGVFPQFHLFAQYLPRGALTEDCFPQPDPDRSYPVVGLIDSGTDPNNALLQAWVVDRDEVDVPQADQDNSHGSFVAGLIINGRGLNHGDSRFPNTQAKIVDVVAMPKDSTPVDETDLLRTIRRAVQKYRDVKVWNLSVSRTDMVCTDDGFSDFAIELDAIQHEHGVTFVTCAGNYSEPPLRGWPPQDLGEKDRLFPPADSVLGITVGSMAHLDRANSRVRKEEPSPFSRRGPGAAFLPKPEVCHYGGNCDGNLDYQQIGVVSVDGSRHLSEAIGTSFSTPLISSVVANIRDVLADPVSRNLAKALLVQSAALRCGPVEAPELRYRGFGIPGEIDEILTCAPWQATLILEPQIGPTRRIFAKADFPIPDCFRRSDGRVDGEFLMTLVYDPPLDATAGAEYCQVNVDVSLGTVGPGKDGKVRHAVKIPLEPKDYGKLYERSRIEYGFKWSPVKVYRKRLDRTSGARWQVRLRMHYRAGLKAAHPQTAALVVTMFDPNKGKPVYDDVVRAMNRSGWIHQDLRVSDRIRIRA